MVPLYGIHGASIEKENENFGEKICYGKGREKYDMQKGREREEIENGK